MAPTSQNALNQPDTIDEIIVTGTLVLHQLEQLFSGYPGTPKALISMRFLARSVRQLHSLDQLVAAKFGADAQILYRSMLERLFLYQHLCDQQEFDEFVEWCFVQAYENENAIKSDADLRTRLEAAQRKPSADDQARYKRAKGDARVAWNRPDPRDAAKSLGLPFLYPAGYDYASTFVHPTAYDGINDLEVLLNKARTLGAESDRSTRHNARIAAWDLCRRVVAQPEWVWVPQVHEQIAFLGSTIAARVHEASPVLSQLLSKHNDRMRLVSSA